MAMHVRAHSSGTALGHNKKRSSGTARPTLTSRRSNDGKSLSKRRSADASSTGEDLSPSFNQFCAYCDKQIVTPSSSILYCSESCRHRDSASSPPSSPLKTPAFTSSTEVTRDIIPPLSPTVNKVDSFFRIPSELTMTSSKTAPTTASSRPGHDRRTSEATAHYPGQYHEHTRNRSSQNIPSLSHSLASTASSAPYTPSMEYHRSLPSSRAYTGRPSGKSVDLVSPVAPASLEALTTRTADMHMWERAVDAKYGARGHEFYGDEETLSYEKRRGVGGGSPSSAAGSLKQLFGKDRGSGGVNGVPVKR